MKTSINFKNINSDSEIHNFRRKTFDYIRKDLTPKNEYWFQEKVAERKIKIENFCKEKSGRKLQKNAMPIREAVVVIKETTTMLDLQNLSKKLEEELGIRIFQIFIHKDEGHYDKETKEWKPNYHAHLVADWQDLKTGKTLKHQSFHYSMMQDITAECLGMERGVSGSQSRLEALEFKIKKKEEEYTKLLEKSESLKNEFSGKKVSELVSTKTDFLGFKKIQNEETVSNFNKVFLSLKSENVRLKNEAEGKSKKIAEIEKDLMQEKKESNGLRYAINTYFSDSELYKKEREKYLKSIEKMLKLEIDFQIALYPNRKRENSKEIEKELIEVCNKIIKKNNIPVATFKVLLANPTIYKSMEDMFKPKINKIEKTEDEEIKREQGFGRGL